MIVGGPLERLTPVLMTALVTAFALTPLLFWLFGRKATEKLLAEKAHTSAAPETREAY
jgi:multidrug efflux pump subunit AcrB